MDNEKYITIFKKLGIPIEPVPLNYTPDEFGRRLYSMSHTERGVTYAASTDYTIERQQQTANIKQSPKTVSK